MSNTQEFVCFIRPTRPGFVEEQPLPEEMAIMGEHFAYLKQLLADGKLVLAGPALDRSFGMSLVRAVSEEEARELMENDPSVQKGVMTFSLHPFRIGLLVGRDS